MPTGKKRVSFLLAMILIVSFPLGSIVFAEGHNSGSQSIQICQTYTKHMDSVKRNEIQIVIHNNGTATASFETTMNCVEVTFSDYTYVGSPQPYENQVLFSSKTLQAATPGKHSLTIDLPQCGPSQLDVYLGPVQTQLKPGTGHDFLIKYAFQDAAGCTTAPPTTTPSSTPSSTPSASPSASPSPTPSSTPSASPSTSPSPTPSSTPSGSPPESAEPTETTIIIEEEPIPRGGPNENADQSTDENLPPVDTLPKTGATSRAPYYLLGSFVIVSGLIMLGIRDRQKE